MSRRGLLIVHPILLLSLVPVAGAQVLQRNFDPQRNGRWTVVDLAPGEGETYDPRGLAVGADGEVFTVAKVPLDGPPTGGRVLRVDTGERLLHSGNFGEDPATLTVEPEGLLVATKGTRSERRGTVLRHGGDGWTSLLTERPGSELRSVARHGGELFAATANDGVRRLVEGRLELVGATTTVLSAGFVWERLGDYAADLESIARLPNGDLVAAGKDGLVRRFDGETWTNLGNLTEVQFDEAGAPLSQLREAKGLAITAGGEIWVGTKGLAGAPEGKDKGAVWRWTVEGWETVGQAAFVKEVKALVVRGPDDVAAQTNESGIWLWNGTQWTQQNAGLALDGGKPKVEALVAGPDGALYASQRNSLRKLSPGAESWTEIGFFSFGEEIKGVTLAPDGTVFVGCRVGLGQGAVYRLNGSEWVQVGGDLVAEVKQLLVESSSSILAVLGANAEPQRWNGTDWSSAAGSLTGNAATFKGLLALGEGEYVAATKEGAVRGEFRAQPVEIVAHALKGLEGKALLAAGDRLYAVMKKGGVFCLAEDPTTDDGKVWRRCAPGLPDVELEGGQVVGNHVYLFAKTLLYRGAILADGSLEVEPVGVNPGKALLDGDGNLVFAGETEFFSLVVAPDGRLFGGTKDGLFVTGDAGETWTLFNGPAEVRGLLLVGSVLYALVKGEVVPDLSVPDQKLKVAGVWSIDLEAADLPPVVEDEKKDGPRGKSGWAFFGCNSFGAGGLLSLLSLLALRRRRIAHA